MSNPISDYGLSVVYAPEEGSPLLDIVIVHGMQGHPFKTWATKTPKGTRSGHESPSQTPRDVKRSHRNILGRIFSKVSTRSSQKTSLIEPSNIVPSAENASKNSTPVFWPRDLAPKDCPRSCILVYGYDSKVSKYLAGPTNKSRMLSHGKDLLYALGRDRPRDRPLIFLAHSLGGIVVKEALAASSWSADANMKNVVESTAGVIFLGTPHRGSSDLSDLGERARTILSAFRMETNPAMLDTLGLKTSDLERVQESFSRLWHKYNFKVKTFQEGLGLTGLHLGVLGNKVVPDYSSCLGDYRERAETIQANHMEMCRFTGEDDPKYRQVAGELRSMYESLREPNTREVHQDGSEMRQPIVHKAGSIVPSMGVDSKAEIHGVSTLQRLKFPHMDLRYRSLPRPADKTCSWLFQHAQYWSWWWERGPDYQGDLLLLRGKPGAGKSVLMKEAHRQISLVRTVAAPVTATFFFNAQGQELERSVTGMFRSLLYQILPLYQEELDRFNRLWDDENAILLEEDLRWFFESLFSKPRRQRTFIFIDALDECDVDSTRSLAYFWREITLRANKNGANLKVLMSMRHYPHISLDGCPEILVDQCNERGIKLYIDQRTSLVEMPAETKRLLSSILVKESRGVFLWAALMLNRMLEKWDQGELFTLLRNRGAHLPRELDVLFTDILTPIDDGTKQTTIRIFQWAALAVIPLRLHEWRHLLAFINRPQSMPLKEWRTPEQSPEEDDQLEKQIKELSRGLLEMKHAPAMHGCGQEVASTKAGAGSLDLSHGETRVLEFIHESVREFFLHGNGFSSLDPSLGQNPRADGHISIMKTCLDYLGIVELDALVEARRKNQYKIETFQRSEPESVPHMLSEAPDDAVHNSGDPISIILPSQAFDRYSSLYRGPEDNGDSLQQNEVLVQGLGPEEPRQQLPVSARHKELLFSKALKSLSATTCRIDIGEWVATNELHTRENNSSEPECGSVAPASTEASTQVLQVYPALLSYATSKLFSHARKAQLERANPKGIVRRLQGGSWARWLLLKETEVTSCQLHAHAQRHHLQSWYRYTSSDSAGQIRHLYRDRTNPLTRNQRVSPREPRKREKELGSVGSFSSASSHFSTDSDWSTASLSVQSYKSFG